MTLSDFLKLIRHYFKLILIVPIACVVVSSIFVFLMPSSYVARATLLTSGDIALAGGFAQAAAIANSQNDIEVTTTTNTSYRTITIEAEGSDYGGCIAAANATVLAAADDCKRVNDQVSISANQATIAEKISPSLPKVAIISLGIGLFASICVVLIIDLLKKPIKSRRDVEAASGLPVIGVIPTRDRGERLLANIRFSSEEQPTSIAVVPAGLTGVTLTCAELMSAFEHAGISVTRMKGNAHAQSLNSVALPGITTIVECASLNEGMGAVYIAKDADITILCATEWVDSCDALAAVVEELRFAKATLCGVVFLSAAYSEKTLY